MKVARILLTPEFLSKLLSLPIMTDIVSAGWAWDCIELTIKHPDLKDVALTENELPPIITPTFRSHQPVEFIGWGQG